MEVDHAGAHSPGRLDVDVSHGDPDGIMLLQLLLLPSSPHRAAVAVVVCSCCSGHSHLLNYRHPIRKSDVVEILTDRGATVRGRRRCCAMAVGRKEGKVTAVAMVVLSPFALLLLLLMEQLRIVASFPQPN